MVTIKEKIAATMRIITKYEEKIVAVIRTTVITEILAVIKITAIIIETFKLFRKRAIITTRKKIAIMAAKTSKKE